MPTFLVLTELLGGPPSIWLNRENATPPCLGGPRSASITANRQSLPMVVDGLVLTSDVDVVDEVLGVPGFVVDVVVDAVVVGAVAGA
mgnify:CR=1 FL=1